MQPVRGDTSDPVALAASDDKAQDDFRGTERKVDSQQESVNFRKVREWKGDIRKETIEHSLFKKDEAINMMK